MLLPLAVLELALVPILVAETVRVLLLGTADLLLRVDDFELTGLGES